MIGIPELDKLSTLDMWHIVEGHMKIMVKDPRKIQTTVLDSPQCANAFDDILPESTMITLLKMEIETRLEFAEIRQLLDNKGGSKQ